MASTVKAVVLIVFSLLAVTLWGASGNPATRVVHSRSRQFVVGGAVLPPSMTNAPGSNMPMVELDANTLAVSCERIKDTLLRELVLPDVWRGRIYVSISTVLTNNQPPIVGAKLFTDGWQYRIEVPRRIESLKLIRTVVQALLMEIANRNAGFRSAEIPVWLLEGLSQQVARSTETELVLSQPQQTVNQMRLNVSSRHAIRRDPLTEARNRLRTHAPLSFTRLSDPAPENLPEETWRTYQACAHLFVSRLLELSGGRAAVVQMLFLLPHHLNWQTAFLTAFQGLFPRMLNVEKWWAVVLVHFTGLDPMNAWPRGVAAQKLEDIVRPPVLVAGTRKELPQRKRVPLQTIINEWDYLRQRILIKQITPQLAVLRPKMPTEMVPLVDEYRSTLDNYISQRDRTGVARSVAGIPPTSADALVREVTKKLNELDRLRESFGPTQPQTMVAPADGRK